MDDNFEKNNTNFEPAETSIDKEVLGTDANLNTETQSDKSSSQANVRIWADPPKKKNSFVKTVSLVLIFAIVSGTFAGAGFRLTDEYVRSKNGTASTDSSGSVIANSIANVNVSKTSSSIINIAKEVGPSVVSIDTKYKAEDFFMREYIQSGQGSGVIFNKDDKRILIVTNYHVIQKSQEIKVNLSNGKELPASIVGYDVDTDLAVIQVKKADVDANLYSSVKPATFGDSDTLQVGEPAVAIGTPISYENTVTVGVISGLNRKLQMPGKSLTLIQTDAAINPGNSGGALVNISGEVIGINSVKVVDAEIEGIGFAIPINIAKPIINELVANGSIARPYFGISGQDVDESLASRYGLPVGVFVAQVAPGSPAQIAGIQAEDVIIQFGDLKFPKMEDIKSTLQKSKVGDSIKVKYIRGNNSTAKEVTVVLKSAN